MDPERQKLLLRIEELLAENAGFDEYPDGATWNDVAEVEERMIQMAREAALRQSLTN